MLRILKGELNIRPKEIIILFPTSKVKKIKVGKSEKHLLIIFFIYIFCFHYIQEQTTL
jgi:hypothetical protein